MEFAYLYARVALATSKTIAKVYELCWPAKVYVEWIFENFKTAEETSDSLKNTIQSEEEVEEDR